MNPMFYFLLALTAVLAATANASIPIVDRFGDPLVVGRSYYVFSDRDFAHIGVLTLDPRGDNKCSLYVGLKKTSVGIPVRFSNWMSRVGFVPESENLNIEMTKDTICGNSTYWRVASSEEDGNPQFIAAGIKSQSGEYPTSFFQIKEYSPNENVYKFAYCPSDKDCIDLGLYDESFDSVRLALTNKPTAFVFLPRISII